MDPISAFLEDNKIPLGRWGKQLFNWLTDSFDWFFDGIATGIETILEALIDLLLLPPPIVIIALVAALAWWLSRSWKVPAIAIGCLAFVVNQGLWKETVETLALVVGAASASMAIGVPVGIVAAHNDWLFRILRPVLDLMQTLPTFVYLIPALILFGLGLAPGLVTTVIFSIAAPIRLTHLGITSVPKQLIEAGQSRGHGLGPLIEEYANCCADFARYNAGDSGGDLWKKIDSILKGES